MSQKIYVPPSQRAGSSGASMCSSNPWNTRNSPSPWNNQRNSNQPKKEFYIPPSRDDDVPVRKVKQEKPKIADASVFPKLRNDGEIVHIEKKWGPADDLLTNKCFTEGCRTEKCSPYPPSPASPQIIKCLVERTINVAENCKYDDEINAIDLNPGEIKKCSKKIKHVKSESSMDSYTFGSDAYEGSEMEFERYTPLDAYNDAFDAKVYMSDDECSSACSFQCLFEN